MAHLGAYVALQRGTTYKSRLLDQPGPVLLGLASIRRDGGFRSDSLRTYGGESPERLLLRPGDLYVSLKDVTQSGDLLGATSRVPPSVSLGRLTQDTVKLVLSDERLRPGYLYWLLRTPQYRNYCRAHAIGTTNLSLSREDFLAFPVPEQTAKRLDLVRLLDALEDKIELNRRMVRTLHVAGWTLFAARHLHHRAREQWPVEPIGEHIEAVRGLSYTGSGLTDGQGLPLHNLDSVYEGGRYKREGIKWYVGDYKEQHLVRPGDLIVANTDLTWNFIVIASPAIVPTRFGEIGLFSHHLYRVRPKQGSPLTSRFLYFLLLRGALRAEVAGYANGTTVNMLPRDALERPRSHVPPAEVVREIDALTAPLHELAELAEDESETLANLRDTLLPRLISGEIRVREAEDAVEAAT